MSNDLDVELSPDQWETLRSLRNPPSNDRVAKSYLVGGLVELGLVVIGDGMQVLTPAGRKVLVRGSCRLLDLVA